MFEQFFEALGSVLNFFYTLIPNYGISIMLLTVLVMVLITPLTVKSTRSMLQMQRMQPEMKRLQAKYKDDREQLNAELMKFYKENNINPLGGCLPILVQIPVFIALYWVLLGAVEMRGAPWILWIKDLAAPDPFYILPVIMMASMFVQTKLNPTPPDPIQAKVMMMMPLIFGFMFFWFPAGLVLYWVVNNILSIAQQWQITRMIEAGGKAANDAKA